MSRADPVHHVHPVKKRNRAQLLQIGNRNPKRKRGTNHRAESASNMSLAHASGYDSNTGRQLDGARDRTPKPNCFKTFTKAGRPKPRPSHPDPVDPVHPVKKTEPALLVLLFWVPLALPAKPVFV